VGDPGRGHRAAHVRRPAPSDRHRPHAPGGGPPRANGRADGRDLGTSGCRGSRPHSSAARQRHCRRPHLPPHAGRIRGVRPRGGAAPRPQGRRQEGFRIEPRGGDRAHHGGIGGSMTDFANVGRLPWHQRGFFATQTFYVTLAFLALAIVMALLSPAFLTGGNLYNISKNFSFIGIVSLGVTLVIITGGIDLSVGSVMALTAIVTVMLMKMIAATPLAAVPGLALFVTLFAGLGLAALIGAINGVLIARLQLSPFVTTLGMLSMARGLCYVVTQGRGQAPSGPDVDIFYAITDGRILGLPLPLIYMVLLALLMGLALHHTA